jgi:hypothetical protein
LVGIYGFSLSLLLLSFSLKGLPMNKALIFHIIEPSTDLGKFFETGILFFCLILRCWIKIFEGLCLLKTSILPIRLFKLYTLNRKNRYCSLMGLGMMHWGFIFLRLQRKQLFGHWSYRFIDLLLIESLVFCFISICVLSLALLIGVYRHLEGDWQWNVIFFEIALNYVGFEVFERHSGKFL